MEKIDLLKNNNVNVEGALEIWGEMKSYEENLLEFKGTLNSKLACAVHDK